MASDLGFREALEGEDRLEALRAIRDRIIDTLDVDRLCTECGEQVTPRPADVAVLVKQLVVVVDLIDACVEPEESASDDIAQQRARLRSAGLQESSAPGVQRGRSRRRAG